MWLHQNKKASGPWVVPFDCGICPTEKCISNMHRNAAVVDFVVEDICLFVLHACTMQ